MTSFVREILSATGKLDGKEDFLGTAQRLQKRLEENKAKMRSEMESQFVDFVSPLSESSALVRDLESSVEEVESVRNQVERHLKPGLKEKSKELRELIQQLNELSTTVQVGYTKLLCSVFVGDLYEEYLSGGQPNSCGLLRHDGHERLTGGQTVL